MHLSTLTPKGGGGARGGGGGVGVGDDLLVLCSEHFQEEDINPWRNVLPMDPLLSFSLPLLLSFSPSLSSHSLRGLY